MILAYILIGVVYALLRFLVIALVARAITVKVELGFVMFAFMALLWPYDLAHTLWKVASAVWREFSEHRTTKRMGG